MTFALTNFFALSPAYDKRYSAALNFLLGPEFRMHSNRFFRDELKLDSKTIKFVQGFPGFTFLSSDRLGLLRSKYGSDFCL